MLLIEEDERIEPDTLWKELIVSATVRAENSLSDMTERFDFDSVPAACHAAEADAANDGLVDGVFCRLESLITSLCITLEYRRSLEELESLVSMSTSKESNAAPARWRR